MAAAAQKQAKREAAAENGVDLDAVAASVQVSPKPTFLSTGTKCPNHLIIDFRST